MSNNDNSNKKFCLQISAHSKAKKNIMYVLRNPGFLSEDFYFPKFSVILNYLLIVH